MSHLVHERSSESAHSALDLFSVPPTQTSVSEGRWVEYHPLATLAESAPIEFCVSGGGSAEYLDLSSTYLRVVAKVVDGTGGELDNVAPVAPVNYYLHALFSQVDVWLNDTLVTASENTYATRAYLEALLHYGPDAKRGHLSSALWYADTAGKMTSTTRDNNGYEKRRELAAKSKSIDMMGRLHVDIFQQGRYMVNGVDVKIRLVPSKSTFNLISSAGDGTFKSVITEATLYVRKQSLNPAVTLSHAKLFERGATVKYPLKRVKLHTFTVASGSTSHVQDNLFITQTPNKVIVGLQPAETLNGSLDRNPFQFDTHGLTYFCAYVNGKLVPNKPLTPNYTAGHYIRCYHGLMAGTGWTHRDGGCGITRSEYPKGYALYALDLTPSLLDDHRESFELSRSGAMRMEFKFAEALTYSLTVVVWAQMDGVIEVDRTRQVQTDFL